RLVCYLLSDFGFEVLAAAHSEEAIRMVERRDGSIRLLLTDGIMPGMNGRAIADRLTGIPPGLKLFYMSGYADQIISEGSVIDRSVAYLQKPFADDRLSQILRRCSNRSPARLSLALTELWRQVSV